MQVRAAPSQFTRRVNQHPVCRADDAHQLAFRHHGAASNTSALGNVLHALHNFPSHLVSFVIASCFFRQSNLLILEEVASGRVPSQRHLFILLPKHHHRRVYVSSRARPRHVLHQAPTRCPCSSSYLSSYPLTLLRARRSPGRFRASS